MTVNRIFLHDGVVIDLSRVSAVLSMSGFALIDGQQIRLSESVCYALSRQFQAYVRWDEERKNVAGINRGRLARASEYICEKTNGLFKLGRVSGAAGVCDGSNRAE